MKENIRQNFNFNSNKRIENKNELPIISKKNTRHFDVYKIKNKMV
jgi:hypothetical protein